MHNLWSSCEFAALVNAHFCPPRFQCRVPPHTLSRAPKQEFPSKLNFLSVLNKWGLAPLWPMSSRWIQHCLTALGKAEAA